MIMKLFNRFITLARADAHGVIDSLEDTELILKQCLREAEVELDRKRSSFDAIANQLDQMEKDRLRLNREVQQLEADIALALKQDQDELARYSVRKFLAKRKQEEELSLSLPEQRESYSNLEVEISTQEEELIRLKEKVRNHLAKKAQAHASPPESPVAEEEIELELLRRRGQQTVSVKASTQEATQ
jgi:phage shock protein A